MSRFPETEQLWKCRQCNFRELCHGKDWQPPARQTVQDQAESESEKG